MISDDSFETIVPCSLSQSTGTVTREVQAGSALVYTPCSVCWPLTVSGTTPGPGSNVQPSSPISQCTTDNPMTSSSPFTLRRINVRCAQGQAKDTYR